MSVQLCEIKPHDDFDGVEVMAPDYDAENFWLWHSNDRDTRIDLNRTQLRELRDALTEILSR